MSPEVIAQYGIPGVLAFILIGVGRAASKLLDKHLETLDRMVTRLDAIDQKVGACPLRVARESIADKESQA